MAQVTVKVNGYAYTVGCEDGQESHLQAMSTQVDGRIDSIKALGGNAGEARLLLLAALLMADEIHDLRIELDVLRRAAGQTPRWRRPASPSPIRSRSGQAAGKAGHPRGTDCGQPRASLSRRCGAARYVRYFIPGADKHLPGTGAAMILVMVPGAHLLTRALGG